MLDCPLQSQTSPIRMSLNSMRLFPSMVIVCGVEFAGLDGRSTRQRPLVSVVVSACWVPSRTVTFSPAEPKPNTRIGWFLCSTMWLLNMLGSEISAIAVACGRQNNRQAATKSKRILMSGDSGLNGHTEECDSVADQYYRSRGDFGRPPGELFPGDIRFDNTPLSECEDAVCEMASVGVMVGNMECGHACFGLHMF